jgi:hypothetical protein
MPLPEKSRHLQPLLDSLNAGDQKAIRKAIRAMKDIETANRLSVLDLFSEISAEYGDMGSVAMKALTDAGADAVPLLTVALRHRSPDARSAAIRALSGLGVAGLPGLIAGVKSRRVDVRRQAVRALEELGGRAKGAVPCLVEALGTVTLELQNEANRDDFGDYHALRIEIVETLMAMGPAAAGAVPQLRSLLKKGGTIGYHSALALGEIGLAAREAVPDLVGITLHDAADDPSLRIAAAAALEKIGSTEGMAVGLKETPTETDALKILPKLTLFYLVMRLYSEGASSFRNASELVEEHLFNEFTRDNLPVSHVAFGQAARDVEPFFRELLGRKHLRFLEIPKPGEAFVLTPDAQAAWGWTNRFLHRHLKADWFGFSRLLPQTAVTKAKKPKSTRKKNS